MKTPRCVKCGKPLTDPFSIAVGMGPDCRGGLRRKGWKLPRPKWKLQRGRPPVFVGYSGRIEPPPVTTREDDALIRRMKRKAEHEPDDEHQS